jgi:hypothetical protein
MKNNKITFQRWQTVLDRLGYSADTSRDKGVVYHHPESRFDVFLPRMRRNEIVRPIHLLAVQHALADGGIVPKEDFDGLFHPEPIDLWHTIIDAQAAFQKKHGHPPTLLRLPVTQAYDLAKLPNKELGPLSERVLDRGIKVFEKEGLLGVPVKLVRDEAEFVFE